MKVKHFFLSMMAVAFLSSAISVDNGLEIGKNAPQIETIDGSNVGYDAKAENKTLVVSFWNPKFPASRINNRILSDKYSQENREDVSFISICTDNDEVLMKEVMKIDGVNHENSFSSTQINPRVFKDYGVEQNPKAFVISPQGKITEII